MAKPNDSMDMDVAAFDLILSNLLEIMTEDHDPCTGHMVLGGMYLAVELMKDPELRPIVEKAMEMPPDLQRIRNTVALFRANLIENPTGLNYTGPPLVSVDKPRMFVIEVGDPDETPDDAPGDPDTTLLDGPF